MPTIQQVGKPRVRLRALPAALPLNIELQATDEAIQWRYVGAADDTWLDLVQIDDIDVEVTIGAVTTLAAGEPASVFNSGTSRDIVLDFGIPAGSDGTMSSVVAGSGIDVDATDPGNPIVSVEANLQSFNSVAPTANGLSLVSAANYAAMKALLDLEIGTDVQAYDADLASWAAITRASGYDTFAATPSSANLRTLLTDETGSGAAVFATSPTITDVTVSDSIDVGPSSFPATSARIQIGNTQSSIIGVASCANSAVARTHYAFENSNGVVGSIVTTGSATAYNTSSDYRLKDDVTPLVTFSLDADDFAFLPDALRLIMLIDPVSYVWRADPSGPRSHGFIAHDLQKAFPHAVSGEKDAVTIIGTVTVPERTDPETDAVTPKKIIEGISEEAATELYPDGKWVRTGERIASQGVDYSKLVTDLTAAVQSLTVIVLEQQQRLDAAGL